MLLLLNAGFARAAPVRLTHPTSPGEPSYVSHSGHRGTVEILLSCIITLTLCVYTSIHLNVTPQRRILGIKTVWMYKFYWVFISTFAPELVLYAAYLQWKNAQMLCRLLKEFGGKPHRNRTLVDIILSKFPAVKVWIDNTFGRDPAPMPLQDPSTGTGRPDVVLEQQEMRSNSEDIGLELRDLSPLESAGKRRSDQPESGLGQSGLEQPTTQLRNRTPENLTPSEHIPRNSTPRERAPLNFTPPRTTPRNPTPPGSAPPNSTPSEHVPRNPTPPQPAPPSSTSSEPAPRNSAQSQPRPSNSTPSEPTPSNVQPDQSLWCNISMVSAFYILMGGFAYDLSDLSDDYRYIALTPEGFMDLAREGHIHPDILNNDDISDRSKADSLGKLLVCIQALWMVVNCIARKASDKPTTLIELNVIVHVVVVVVVYGLWWYKPLAVANPTLLSRQSKPSSGLSVVGTGDTEVLEALAVGCAPSGGWGVGDWGEHDYERYPPYQVDGNHLHQEFNVKIEPYIPDPSNFEVCGSPILDKKSNKKLIAQLKLKSSGIILLPGQKLLLKAHNVAIDSGSSGKFISPEMLRQVDLWHLHLKRVRVAPLDEGSAGLMWANFFRGIGRKVVYDPPNYSVHGSVCIGDIHKAGLDFDLMENVAMLFVTGLLSLFYAGAHASAWSSHFPSYIERWIWRGACICIAVGVPFVCSICIPLRVFKHLAWERLFGRYYGWRETIGEYLYKLCKILFWIFLVFSTALYILARLFIPVEAFISVRSLPLGAFETVAWMEYWPHV